ncbi:MAG: rRNA pseudouridine synthase [Spirochaetaceae bacterium]|jgi:23S rRNA pseudouridine2605 synthase|nr:rRNA pseudouridine synthase [Spirochaetaceae bacterium]
MEDGNTGECSGGRGTSYSEERGTPDSRERLQKYLARCGVASRRACEQVILAGRVSVNGVVVAGMGAKVETGDTVSLDGEPVTPEQKLRYVVLNKPAGYVSSLADEKGRPTAAGIIANRYPERLYNVGRLDMYSSGLLIFTNDGDFARRVSHPSSQIEKEYLAETTAPFPVELPVQFTRGIRIDGTFYRASQAKVLGGRALRIVLMEGKNREIRRVFAHFDVPVKRLVRVRIGDILLKDLPEGECRDLSPEEITGLIASKNYSF